MASSNVEDAMVLAVQNAQSAAELGKASVLFFFKSMLKALGQQTNITRHHIYHLAGD